MHGPGTISLVQFHTSGFDCAFPWLRHGFSQKSAAVNFCQAAFKQRGGRWALPVYSVWGVDLRCLFNQGLGYHLESECLFGPFKNGQYP